MRHVDHHKKFYKYAIQLNSDRKKRLNRSVTAIQNFIIASGYDAEVIGFERQGSWEHGTMIRPLKGKEYDADIMLLLCRKKGWSVSNYIENLYDEFRSSRTYKAKAGRSTRCVTIDYTGDFHLDIVPCIVDERGFVRRRFEYHVCNRTEQEFERTDGPGFAEWLHEKNSIADNNMLLKVIQVMKYLRDHKQTFAAKSVLLTTLLAE